ncbi:MAG: hypothetical protein SFV54_26475 [Bryobacteraceae bacterium]|nr:hypothetical protein [Bryobacteraceae bacterium]
MGLANLGQNVRKVLRGEEPEEQQVRRLKAYERLGRQILIALRDVLPDQRPKLYDGDTENFGRFRFRVMSFHCVECDHTGTPLSLGDTLIVGAGRVMLESGGLLIPGSVMPW